VSSFQINWRSQLSNGIIYPCRSLLLSCLAISLLVSSSGCNGENSLQNTFAPDPKLKDSAAVSTNTTDIPVKAVNSLPADFPLYPQAKLQSTVETKDLGTVTTWTTTDPIEFVYKFYQQELPAKQWEIVAAPSDSNPKLEAKQAQINLYH
jgi:hypothetical protein